MSAVVISNSNPITLEQLNAKKDLIKRTVAKGATDDELQLFFNQCARTGLDPFVKQIYFIKYAQQMAIVTGIDGYYAVAARTGELKSMKTEFIHDDKGTLIAARTKIERRNSQTGHVSEYESYVRLSEFKGRSGSMWDKMVYRMLEKTAESHAIRKAFSDHLSGITTREEMEQSDIYEEAPPGFDPKNPNHVRFLTQEAKHLGVTDIKDIEAIARMMIGKSHDELPLAVKAVLSEKMSEPMKVTEKPEVTLDGSV